MVRTIVGGLIGAVLGGIICFPPAVPLSFTLDFAVADQGPEVAILRTIALAESLFYILPAIGVIIGGIVGAIIGKYRLYRVLSKHWTLSLFIGSIILFWLLGLETGFILSPVTMIGLGNTTTWPHLWLFSIVIGSIGLGIGFIVGLLLMCVRLIYIKR
jgi:hypothetical protein